MNPENTKIIWALFTIIFLMFTLFHFIKATKNIKPIQNTAKVKTIGGVPLGIHEFVESFNKYIDQVNYDSRIINIVTGVAYSIAAGTALFSYFLS